MREGNFRPTPIHEVEGKFGREIRKHAEHKETRGRFVNLEFSFTRHGVPEKDPATGLSKDIIIPEGLEAVRQKGKQEETSRYIMVTGSQSVKRARQTGQYWTKGVTETGMANIINRTGQKEGGSKEFGIYPTSELDIVEGAGNVLQPIVKKWKEIGLGLVKEGKIAEKELQGWVEGKAMGEFLDLPEETFRNFKWKDKKGNEHVGVPSPHDKARAMAHRLWSGIRMSGRLYEGMDTKVNNFTHGTNPESLLKYIIKLPAKDHGTKTGFDSVEEVGGTLTPGESMDFMIERDKGGKLKPVIVNFRGKKYEIDMAALEQLSKEYETEKKAKRATK